MSPPLEVIQCFSLFDIGTIGSEFLRRIAVSTGFFEIAFHKARLKRIQVRLDKIGVRFDQLSVRCERIIVSSLVILKEPVV